MPAATGLAEVQSAVYLMHIQATIAAQLAVTPKFVHRALEDLTETGRSLLFGADLKPAVAGNPPRHVLLTCHDQHLGGQTAPVPCIFAFCYLYRIHSASTFFEHTQLANMTQGQVRRPPVHPVYSRMRALGSLPAGIPAPRLQRLEALQPTFLPISLQQ